MKKYIHYGTNSFDLNKFSPIQNRYSFNKPLGGLWASPIDSADNWFDWCCENNFRMDKLSKSFQFDISPTSNIISIASVNDGRKLVSDLPEIFSFDRKFFDIPELCIDFEKLLAHGIDAISFKLNAATYWLLYGWDVDSLLVLNPDCIIL